MRLFLHLIDGLKGKYPGVLFILCIPVFIFLINSYPAEGGVRSTPQTVRVCIAQKLIDTSFSVQGKYRLVDKQTGNVIGFPANHEEWNISSSGGKIEVINGNKSMGFYTGPVVLGEIKQAVYIVSGDGIPVQKEGNDKLAVQGQDGEITYLEGQQSDLWVQGEKGVSTVEPAEGLNLIKVKISPGEDKSAYRGELEIRLAEGGLLLINQLAVEDYLYGVVPSEMPASFPAEALKAQAVVARSYLATSLSSYSSQGFDLLSTQGNQVYKGYSAEHPVTSNAVNATRGEILVFGDQPVSAFYHSSSGGYTENSEDVWSSSLPYIRSKADPFDRCEGNKNHYNWRVVYTQEELIKQLLTKEYELKQIDDLMVKELTSSGKRVQRLVIAGIDMEDNPKLIEISGADAVRNVLGLKSALFVMDKEYDDGHGNEDNDNGRLDRVTITGSGWGHGLGMSQWGARGMAEQGYNYLEILQYYYTGVSIMQG